MDPRSALRRDFDRTKAEYAARGLLPSVLRVVGIPLLMAGTTLAATTIPLAVAHHDLGQFLSQAFDKPTVLLDPHMLGAIGDSLVGGFDDIARYAEQLILRAEKFEASVREAFWNGTLVQSQEWLFKGVPFADKALEKLRDMMAEGPRKFIEEHTLMAAATVAATGYVGYKILTKFGGTTMTALESVTQMSEKIRSGISKAFARMTGNAISDQGADPFSSGLPAVLSGDRAQVAKVTEDLSTALKRLHKDPAMANEIAREIVRDFVKVAEGMAALDERLKNMEARLQAGDESLQKAEHAIEALQMDATTKNVRISNLESDLDHMRDDLSLVKRGLAQVSDPFISPPQAENGPRPN